MSNENRNIHFGCLGSGIFFICMAAITGSATAQPDPAVNPLASRVLILVNDAMPAEAGTGSVGASLFVGEYYAQQRGIPLENIFHVTTTTSEAASLSDYRTQIETPLKAFLDADDGALRKKFLYIVPTFGIPVRTSFPGGQVVSVDSLLSAMYAGPNAGVPFKNPYWNAQGSRPPHFDVWADQRESSALWKMFIVSRLDGPSARIAVGIVDKAVSAESTLTPSSGSAYFDYQGTRTPSEPQYQFDEEIRSASLFSKARGFNTVLNTQARALCGLLIRPASLFYYDASAKNVFIDAVGGNAATSFSFAPVSEGEVVVRLQNETIANTGNFVYLTLGTADPKTYVKLSYPLVPFTGYSVTDSVTLEKIVNGNSVAKAVVPVDKSMEAKINGVTEFRVVLLDSNVSVLRNGLALASSADSSATKINVTKISIAAQCWNYRLKGLAVSDKSGKSIWNDSFTTDSTSNYTWDLSPLQGKNALWAWGWYGSASDSYRFVNGAVGAQLTSYTANQIRTPQNANPAVNSVQSIRWGGNWVPRMLEQGVTATWGAVAEPYANLYAPGGNVFDHFWSGYNFGESFFIAQNVLNWVMMAVGDPLYAPQIFKNAPLSAAISNASGLPGPVAPGQIISFLGQDIGPINVSQGKLNAAGLVDTVIENTRVLFDGVAAPLLYAGTHQVVAIVPYALDGQTATQAQVEISGVLSNTLYLDVSPAVPGIFTQNNIGVGPGSIRNEDTSPNTTDNPAAKGSTIVLYATGEGQTDPPGIDGKLAADAPPKPIQPIAVRIGGIPAELIAAGGVPGQPAGNFQVSVKVPGDTPSGDAIPIVLSVGSNASQPGVTLAVR